MATKPKARQAAPAGGLRVSTAAPMTSPENPGLVRRFTLDDFPTTKLAQGPTDPYDARCVVIDVPLGYSDEDLVDVLQDLVRKFESGEFDLPEGERMRREHRRIHGRRE